ncbi:MAG: SH3 domain-containing protein [Candidatus Shapirobacteria bacterium]|jgi:hypothetical protein
MKLTHKLGIFLNICLIITAVIFAFPKLTLATQYQQCAANSTCAVGEFLYDDNYQTISVGTTCTLTSRYPNGDVLLNVVTMDVSTDGYYSYSVGTSGLNNGVYRTQMCCLTGTDNICLDKTFEISTTSSSLVADIWAYPNRALTSFGSLVSSIWSNSSRQLTSSNLENGTSLATTDSVSSIGTSLAVIETKIDTISDKIDTLQTSINSIQSDTTNILNKWSTYNVTDILNYVDSLETQLGNNTQTCSDNTTFGQIQCLIDKWGTNSASTIYSAANNAYITAATLQSELNFNGKSTTAYDEIIAIKAYVDTIESSIGSTSDTSSTASIFGRIKQVKEAIDAIDNSTLDLNDLLAKWDDLSANDIYDKITALSTQVASLNTISNVDNITNNNITQTTDLTDLKDIKNQVLAMRALLDVNRTQLESLVNKPIIKTWLEQGSIIFKTLITNPSKSLSQDVPFVYYFPPEVKQSNIIKKSDSLEIKYDPAKSVYYATGDFKLKPNETVIVEIEVEDIWTIPDEKLNSLKKQADELFIPLKNTSYFAQGTTLHSDILASLDKIIALQKKAQLPEDKINTFQETKIELDSISRQMDSLKNILSSAGSIGTLSGFIGGVQTAGVWGIIVILVAGFVFLGLYIKSLNSPRKKPPSKVEPPVSETSAFTPHHKSPKKYHEIAFAAVFGLSFGISSVISYHFFQNHFQKTTPTPNVLSETISSALPSPSSLPSVLGESSENTATLTPTVIPTATPTPVSVSKTVVAVKKVIVTPSINTNVNLRFAPDRNSTLITRILSGQELAVIGEKYNDLGEKWLNVSYEQFTGWILAELTQAVQNPSTTSSSKINIIVPDHDTVYLYSKPSFNASITSKINEDQSADILVETKRWAKVILSRANVEGWISQDFIEKNIP